MYSSVLRNKNYSLVLLFVIVLVTLGTVACEVAEPTPLPNPTRVDLRTILDMRDANEVAADAKYIGMYVSMDGKINEIHDKDFGIIPTGSDEYQMSGAKCKFDKSQSADLINLRKGQTITVVGLIKDISDFMFTTIELKPCKFN